MSRLIIAYKASDEYADLKPRTRKDYAYYLNKIEQVFGQNSVRSLSARVIKTYYKRVRRETSITWAYHILSTLRAVLSWAVSEDWIVHNPAHDVTMKSPQKRKVILSPEQSQAYIAYADKLGWYSIVPWPMF
ncbi:MAG: hypothetical protein V4527_14850 [Pseudomonadota bacterium]